MGEQSGSITLVVLLMGRYEALCGEFANLAEQLKALSDVDIVVVADGKAWSSAPLFQMLSCQVPQATVYAFADETSSPARLLESALKRAQGEYIMLTYPLGSPIATRYHLFRNALCKNSVNDTPATYCIRNAAEIPPYIYTNNGNAFGFCQCADIYQLDDLCFPREYLLSCCPLDDTPLLQSQFEKWLSLMVLRGTDMVVAGALERVSMPMCAYPFRYKYQLNDVARRYVLYSAAPTKPLRRDWADVYADFLQDIPVSEVNALKHTVPPSSSISPRYKILLVGGWWEYHHNQICFQNYFECLQGSGFATFCTAFETLLQPSEMAGYDLVIFTRCRSDEAIRLIRFCNEQGIRTLYMIDDNWLSFAKDFPKLGGMFVPGRPDYENFLLALKLVDAVWLFNTYLEEDVKPYCKRTIRFKISVLPSLYESSAPRERSDSSLYVGYAGSLRWSNSIFEALARIAQEDSRIKIVLLGVLSEEQLALFNGLSVIHESFMSYSRYTSFMGRLRPDLMLAPLVDSRTNRSKCYNKYIEFGVVGAAGIYSQAEPYMFVVEEGKNGYFVQSDDADSWYRKLREVLADVPRLREIQHCAQEDVLANHTVDAVVDEFRQKLCSVLGKGAYDAK